MVKSSVSRSGTQRNVFVPPTAPLSPYEQGRALYRLGYTLGVCISDAQANGWLDEEATEKEANRG